MVEQEKEKEEKENSLSGLEIDEKVLKDLEQKEHELEELFEMIKLVTPGTPLREAIDNIAKAGLGALIVIGDSNNVINLINGGFKINCQFSPQKMLELCKMDGAIILSDKLDKVVYCNTMLAPDPTIETDETGTRHKAAERTAKQTNRLVIAISERRKTISLYYKNIKYTLRSSEELLGKAMETMRMLEKYC